MARGPGANQDNNGISICCYWCRFPPPVASSMLGAGFVFGARSMNEQIPSGTYRDARGFTYYADLDRERAVVAGGDFVCDLSHLGRIQVSGDDAEQFLQGQLTNDVKAASTDNFQLHGFCTPKGRLLCVLHLWRRESGFTLQLQHDLVEDTRQYMSRYVLRAKVRIESSDIDTTTFGVVGPKARASLSAIIGPLPPSGGQHVDAGYAVLAHTDPPRPRYQVIGGREAVEPIRDALLRQLPVAGSWSWTLQDIISGIPTVYRETREQFVPQMANLDLVRGISYQKGCYPGQEIVARMHYLGKLKQRMIRGYISGDVTPPVPGDEIHVAGSAQAAGTVVDAQPAATPGYEVSAVVRIAALEQELLLGANQVPLQQIDLPYSIPELTSPHLPGA